MADEIENMAETESNLFYISCTFIDTICKDGLRSLPNGTNEVKTSVKKRVSQICKEVKKRNRRSKLFYVSCDYVDVKSFGDAAEALDFEAGITSENTTMNGQNLAVSPVNRCPSPLSTASHVSSDYSSDVDSSSSSVIVKRRPARPRIDLSSASLSEIIPKEDDFLLLSSKDYVLTSEKNPFISADRGDVFGGRSVENGRPGSADSSTSYLNVVDDHALQRGSDEDQVDAKNEFSKRNTNHNDAPDTANQNTKYYEEFRSESPTSRLLRPLFQYAMSEDIYEAIQSIRSELSPKLGRLKNLEKDTKLLPVLQVKLAVLQEEKRQLMNIIKQKRGMKQSTTSYLSSNSSSPVHSRGSSPTSFISDTEESYLLRPFPRRAAVNKETQTSETDTLFQWVICPYCQKKALDNVERIRDGDEQKKITSDDNSVSRNSLRDEDQKANSEIRLCESTDKIRLDNIRFASTGVQCCASARDNSTVTVSKTLKSVGVGCKENLPSLSDAATETINKSFANKAVGMESCGAHFSDFGVQKDVDVIDRSTEVATRVYCDKKFMTESGIANSIGLQCSPSFQDATFGDDSVVITYRDSETQDVNQFHDNETQAVIDTADKSVTCGCGFLATRSIGINSSVSRSDFECGDAPAEIHTQSASCQTVVNRRSISLDPVEVGRKDFEMHCNLDLKSVVTAGYGDHTVNDLLCDSCSNRKLVSIGVGSYNRHPLKNQQSDEEFCRTDDQLYACSSVELSDKAVGDASVDDVACDFCRNKSTKTVSCGEDRIDHLPCDRCDNVIYKTIGCGDHDVTTVVCDSCIAKSKMVDKSFGDGDVSEVNDGSCDNSNSFQATSVDVTTANNHEHSRLPSVGNIDRENDEVCDEVDRIMANTILAPGSYPVFCNHCGSKVDMNDSNFERDLLEMGNNLSAYRTHHLEVTRGFDNLAVSDENMDRICGDDDDDEFENEEEDDDDGYDESTKNDIVESCKMLQNHFSGEKPLKQQLMMKYLANIEALWFSAVKRKRANAAVVKSYIELFQSRIPELVDTIINLMDTDGNTALHFALTYKNTTSVSILLDSHECQIDLINKAGYSPIMLAALAGFDNKTDKYVMQRLIRAGNVNCKNQETGQTPLMLAVNRGNVGMVELLLDAGADVNETDNDGSTALMCACENGHMATVKALLSNPDCDATIEDHEGSTALSIAMDGKRRDLALLIYGSLNFDVRGRIKLTASKQSLLGLGTRRSPSPVIGKT